MLIPDVPRQRILVRKPQSSANAARGGLKPPPAGRLRRAYLHHPNSTNYSASDHLPTHRTPFTVRDTRRVKVVILPCLRPARLCRIKPRRSASVMKSGATGRGALSCGDVRLAAQPGDVPPTSGLRQSCEFGVGPAAASVVMPRGARR